MLSDGPVPRLAVRNGNHVVALALEEACRKHSDAEIVLDDEDDRRAGRRLGLRRGQRVA